MKSYCTLILVLLVSYSFGQNKVTWSTSYASETGEISITANIEDTWHLYALHLSTEDGPIPTEFQFEENNQVELIGAVLQPEPKVAYDENFGSDLEYFEGEVIFKQKVKLNSPTRLNASVYYMVCDDHNCLPPIEVLLPIELNK